MKVYCIHKVHLDAEQQLIGNMGKEKYEELIKLDMAQSITAEILKHLEIERFTLENGKLISYEVKAHYQPLKDWEKVRDLMQTILNTL